MDSSYIKALENARKELAGLVKQRAETDERIARLAKSIEGLEALCGDTDHSSALKTKLIELELSDSMGLTDAIREIIASSALPIKAPVIRDALVSQGFDPDGYSNMLTVIHNTLIRLERQGEVQKIMNPLGGGFWGWARKAKGLPPPPAREKVKKVEDD
ncbi:MAG TPA: hypothetical protein VOA88_01230 [Candidatus Dormibacteraeota bacterium]|nr:hypothetical protein [Candidatus Dormibacteraeota bacterium]